MIKPYTKAFTTVWEVLSASDKGWEYLFAEEKIDLTIEILELMEKAYDEATDTPAAPNPYRKDDDVLDIINRLRRKD